MMPEQSSRWTEVVRHVITIDGLTVHAVGYRTPDGPAIQLEPNGCSLTGEMPGLYYPVADPVCVCGHTAHWHSHGGGGDCEHDGECDCHRFRPERVR